MFLINQILLHFLSRIQCSAGMSSSSSFFSFVVIFFIVLAISSLRVTIACREIPTPPQEGTSPQHQPETSNGYDPGFLIPGIGRFMAPPLGGPFMVPPLVGGFMVPPFGGQFVMPPFGNIPKSSVRNNLPSSSGGNGVESPSPASSGSLHP